MAQPDLGAAVMIAGAGAAYFNGGFGVWELVFTGIVTACAYRGLRSYRFIGAGWSSTLAGTCCITFTAHRSFHSCLRPLSDAPSAIPSSQRGALLGDRRYCAVANKLTISAREKRLS